MKVNAMDLNLLIVLDAVLDEGSVSQAAQRLNMSVPAASRALGRLRVALGDPLMVRSGRGLQPTAAAVNLKPRVRALLDQAADLLDPADTSATLSRTFTIIAPTDIIAIAGPRLLDRITAEAPHVHLRLLDIDRSTDEADAVRDGTADIAISVNASKHTDLNSQGLVREALTAVVRTGHDLTTGPITPARFAAWPRVMTSRHGRLRSDFDTTLETLGHPSAVVCCVPDFLTGLHLVAASDLVTITPRSLLVRRQTVFGLSPIEAPLTLKPLRVSQLWHSRRHHDPDHQWLRSHIQQVAEKLTAASNS